MTLTVTHSCALPHPEQLLLGSHHMSNHSLRLLQSSSPAGTYGVKHLSSCSLILSSYGCAWTKCGSLQPQHTPSVLFQIGSHPQHLPQADIPTCHTFLLYWVTKSHPWWAATAGMWHNAHRNFGLKSLIFLSYVLGSQRWLTGSMEIKTNSWTYGYQPFSYRTDQAWAP